MPSSNPRYRKYSLRVSARKRVAQAQAPCWICGGAIDYNLPAKTPGAYELDELVPVSRGGSPTDPANLAPTHRMCNQWRGAKSVEQVQTTKALIASVYGGWSGPDDFCFKARAVTPRAKAAGHMDKPRTKADW